MKQLGRAFYHSSIANFISESRSNILGVLAENNHFELSQEQRSAWLSEINILQQTLQPYTGYILFEYVIPRMGKRADVILLIQQSIFVVEFKVGSHSFDKQASDQVMDYVLDLKNFHAGSQHRNIYPILIATSGTPLTEQKIVLSDDGVCATLFGTPENLANLLWRCLAEECDDSITWQKVWASSGYHPTPTIIEAAQALYAGHSVAEISRSDAGTINLSQTTEAVKAIINQAMTQHRKSICFITGVPGAGKTLAGLNIASAWQDPKNQQHAVFLSGNGPLVSILREALSRDEHERTKQSGLKKNKKECERETAAFIQNIHHFRDDMLRSDDAPIEHVVIFDEAQRAWDKEQASSFMQRKRGLADFSISEPEFLLSAMDRHQDWAVIICLIGGGQEINTGEGGIGEWYQALRDRFTGWQVWVSPNLTDSEYLIGTSGKTLLDIKSKEWKPELHLATSVRSFRSEKVSTLVKSLLDINQTEAQLLLSEISDKYPLVLTRDLDVARHWLKSHARGTERYGIIASSGAQRLRPLGIDVKSSIDEISWFLNNKGDVRSSYYTEVVATEFHIQGLELDWTAVVWDADLRFINGNWEYWQFRGSSWQAIRSEPNQRYLKNAYRVLLTRARQGMIIVVPKGNDNDHTRPLKFYDETYNYLSELGIKEI